MPSWSELTSGVGRDGRCHLAALGARLDRKMEEGGWEEGERRGKGQRLVVRPYLSTGQQVCFKRPAWGQAIPITTQ